MKKGIVLPEGFHALSQGEMEKVAGGAMKCSVKGDRGNCDSLRKFWITFFERKK